MDTKELMSGIAIVIDDALAGAPAAEGDASGGEDLIGQIVEWFETEWKLPFVKMTTLPKAAFWPNLLRSASFVLLDWRLWGAGGEMLKQSTIDDIKEFLSTARENLVPVLILTNENPDDVTAELRKLPDDVYDEGAADKNFVFVEQKNGFWTGTSVDVGTLKAWVYGNASVYALKTWHRVMDDAKSELFQAMCRRSVNWPRSVLGDVSNGWCGPQCVSDEFDQRQSAGPHACRLVRGGTSLRPGRRRLGRRAAKADRGDEFPRRRRTAGGRGQVRRPVQGRDQEVLAEF